MYWDVFVAAAVSIILGFLWYGPFFGKRWMKLMNISEKQAQDAKKKGMPASTWFWMLVGVFVTVGIMKVLLIRFWVTGYLDAIETAATLWLGLIAPVQLGSVLWEGKPWELFFMNAAYYLINTVLIAVLLITF